MDFTYRESDVIKEVQELQESIPDLCFHDSYHAISSGPLIPGCEICTRMAHMAVQLGFRCNVRCPFCFLDISEADRSFESEKNDWRSLVNTLQHRKNPVEGVSLTGGEPLLYLSEMAACVTAIRSVKPDVYFWMYTNGILADEDHLKLIADLGISEIRFNLLK
jgi:pyruvate formate-lyase activating enzyme-like uncharacterized protein